MFLRVDRDPDFLASRDVPKKPMTALPVPDFHITCCLELLDHFATRHERIATYR
jgi:hypothetical protein